MKRTLYILIIILIAVCIVFAQGCKKKDGDNKEQPPKAEKTLGPVVAGSFYPSDAQTLREMILDIFKDTPDLPLGDNLLGVISPHAGYVHSGPVAAYIYKNLPKGAFKRVVILFPSHRARFRGIMALNVDAYRTPLGLVRIDRDSIKKLMAADPTVQYKEGVYFQEHSMEVMLPLLQVALGDDFEIIPLMMGDQTPRMAQRLAKDLHQVFGARRVLYIASSDMSHYHPYDVANAVDSRALTDIMNLDELALEKDLSTGKAELCGYGPVLALMRLVKLRGGGKAKVLKHANSGDTSGNREQVVGYCSVAFFLRTSPVEDVQ